MTNHERGIALPSVLVALFALTAVALAMTVSSRTEMTVSGTEMRSMYALQVADAGLNYALSIPSNFSDPVSQPAADLRTAGLPFDGSVTVTYEPPSRLPPPGIHVSALKVRSYYFLLTSVGLLKMPTGNTEPNSTTNLEMEAAKLGPAGT
jgi:hypothetical protein